MTATIEQFEKAIESIDDPRVPGRTTHPLKSILLLTVAAITSGADGPEEIESFGHEKLDWLSEWGEFSQGIPSHDTIGRVLSLICPDQFQIALLAWHQSVQADSPDTDQSDGPELICFDGKTARGSYTNLAKDDALHIVSAFAQQVGLTLGQRVVDSKENEIVAIDSLIDMIDIQGATCTIDAIGAQKRIAEKIVDQQADYVFAIKDNHPKLADAIQKHFVESLGAEERPSGMVQKRTKEKGHGRREERVYTVCPIPESMRHLTDQWAGARSIGQVVNMTHDSRGKETFEVRYYLSSGRARVGEFARSVRGHWSIESLHWILDVVFHEDASRVRQGHAQANLSCLRKFVTSLLKVDTLKRSLKQKRKRAGWNTRYLEKLLNLT